MFKRVSIRFLDGTESTGNAYGNNAGWTCLCGEALVGRSYPTTLYRCWCGRTYTVESDAGTLKAPDRVIEVKA